DRGGHTHFHRCIWAPRTWQSAGNNKTRVEVSYRSVGVCGWASHARSRAHGGGDGRGDGPGNAGYDAAIVGGGGIRIASAWASARSDGAASRRIGNRDR